MCLRRQRSHVPVKGLQSPLQWTCHMLSETSHAPCLRWCSGVASYSTPQGVAHTMIEACTCLPCFDSLKCLSPLSSVFSRPVRGSCSVVLSQSWLVLTASTPGTLHCACRRGVPRPWWGCGVLSCVVYAAKSTTLSGAMRYRTRTSPGWRKGYVSCPRYLWARRSTCASAPSVVIATTWPRISRYR